MTITLRDKGMNIGGQWYAPWSIITGLDPDKEAAAVAGGNALAAAAVDGDGNSPLKTLARIAAVAYGKNPRAVMAVPPTVTADGASLPVGQSTAFLRSTYPTFYRETGGLWRPSPGAFTAAVNIAGGTVSTYGRIRFMADAVKITFRLSGSTVPFRFRVNGEYVSLAGTNSAGTGNQYMTLDFTSAGGRANREIELEIQQDQGFVGVYVGATERLSESARAEIRTVSLGDSYVLGSAATVRGDGLHIRLADELGWTAHMNSGAGGTGWCANPASNYTFAERITNGDLLLNGAVNGAVVLGGSVNDRTFTAAAIQAACVVGLRSARQQIAAGVPIFLLGVFNAPVMVGATTSAAAMEAALAAAVAEVGDPLVYFIPVTGAYGGAWLTGTGWVGATQGNGNADVLLAENTHPNTYGCEVLGGGNAAAAIRRILNA